MAVQSARQVAERILPQRFTDWYRRRRALRRYLWALSYEIHDRRTRLELGELEERVVTGRKGLYEQMVGEVLDRTDLILQGLERRIEGVKARYGNELASLRQEIVEIRALLESREVGGEGSVHRAEPHPSGRSPEQPIDPPATAAEG